MQHFLFEYDFDTSSSHIYFNNVPFFSFLDFWGNDCELELSALYAAEREYTFDIGIADGISSIGSLKQLIIERPQLRINVLKGKVGKYDIYVDDMNEYTINSDEHHLQKILEYVLVDLLDVSQSDVGTITHGKQGKYIMICKGKIVKVFDTFDDYINYDV
jgi:hypothetical protein